MANIFSDLMQALIVLLIIRALFEAIKKPVSPTDENQSNVEEIASEIVDQKEWNDRIGTEQVLDCESLADFVNRKCKDYEDDDIGKEVYPEVYVGKDHQYHSELCENAFIYLEERCKQDKEF